MQKRSLYSLLLTSFILVFAFFSTFAQEVTFESKTVLRCEEGTVDVDVTNPTSITGLEIVFEVSEGSGGAFFDALDVQWDPAFTVLNHRFVDLSLVNFMTADTVRMAAIRDTSGGDPGLAPRWPRWHAKCCVRSPLAVPRRCSCPRHPPPQPRPGRAPDR